MIITIDERIILVQQHFYKNINANFDKLKIASSG